MNEPGHQLTPPQVTGAGRPEALLFEANPNLEQLRERLQFLISSTPAVIYAAAPVPPYGPTFMSGNVEAVLGYEPSRFLNDPDFRASRVHPQDAPALFLGLQRLLEQGHYTHRYRFRHEDGGYRWLRDDLRLVRDSHGKPKEILGCWLDITQSKQAEEALRCARDELELRVKERTSQLEAVNQALLESQERFRQVAENIREVFWLSNTTLSEIIYVSPAYEEIWGRKCAELYQHPQAWFEAIHTDDKPRVRELFEKPIGASGFELDYRVVRPDGSIRWVQDHGFPVRDGAGLIYRVAGLARDITERRMLEIEILNISDREQQRFGQDLHDDLGQQLVGIQFLSNALAQELKGLPQAERAREIAQFVQAATEHARLLARGLAPVQLEADGLMDGLREMAERTRQVFSVRCDFKCPSPVLIKDPAMGTHLYRIAQEAVNNSLRHGKARQIELELGRKGRKVFLRISDDGLGFSPTPVENRGMGLKTMQYRARALGGTLAIEQNRQAGVSVICLVPRAAKRRKKHRRAKP